MIDPVVEGLLLLCLGLASIMVIHTYRGFMRKIRP